MRKETDYMRKKKHRFFVILTLAIIVLAFSSLADLSFGDRQGSTRPSSYSFINIDIPIPAAELGFTSLADINNDGEITGGFTNSTLGPQGFLLSNKFKLANIQCHGTRNVEPNAEPKSINKHGEISGFCFTGRISGFFLNKNGKLSVLNFPGANLTEAIGINDDGQVVGDYRETSGRFHGFLWDDGNFRTLDVPFPDAVLSSPAGINNVGQIVGFYFDNDVTGSFPNGRAHGFLYDNGIFTSFDFPGATATLPADINDHGQIVGIYADNDMVAHSFLLDRGKFTEFDVSFSSVVGTQVSGINNRGQIVGRYLEINPGDPFNPFLSHGFIASPETDQKSKSKLLVSKPNGLSKVRRGPQNVEELSKRFANWKRQLQ
jgi:probable HAF family extracellular repeat protein